MNDFSNIVDNGQLSELLNRRKELLQQLSHIEQSLQNKLEQSKQEAYQALTQASLKSMIDDHAGALKVREIALIADIAPSTYYNIMSRFETTKVGMVQALLNTIGLDLYIGKKLSGTGKKDKASL